MFERMKAEKEEGRGGGERTSEQDLRKKLEKLSKLNTYSSWLNILTLMSLTWHFVYLATSSRLRLDDNISSLKVVEAL